MQHGRREKDLETDVPVYCVPREVMEEAIEKNQNRRATDLFIHDDSPYIRFLGVVQEAVSGRLK